MTHLIPDFVNREEQLTSLWKVIRQESDQRVLLILGPDGIGKTYLLDEFRSECQAEGIACVEIDFAESLDQSYMAIVLGVHNQLGGEGFEHLIQTIAETRTFGAWETVPARPVAANVGRPAPDPGSPGGRSGGVDFHDAATIHGDVVGRDAYYVTQIVQRDDPFVQQMIQSKITVALRDCLTELTAAHQVVFLFNSWHQATTDIRNWLYQNLLSWIANKKLPGSAAVVAGEEATDLRRPPGRIRRLTLPGLPDEAVRIYWIEKRHLPPEEASDVIKYSRGIPVLMAMMAEQRAIALEISG